MAIADFFCNLSISFTVNKNKRKHCAHEYAESTTINFAEEEEKQQ